MRTGASRRHFAVGIALASATALGYIIGGLPSRCFIRDGEAVRPVSSALAETDDGNSTSEANAFVPATPGFVNFYHHPDRFTEVLATCISDGDCHVVFLHIFKTGGTTIERAMFKMFPPADESMLRSELTGHLFPKNKRAYCGAKFGSYQMNGAGLDQIVPQCMQLNSGTNYRVVTLVPLREPTQQFLSWIHQWCNKGLFSYPNLLKEYEGPCNRCSYEEDAEFWDGWAERLNKMLREQLRLSSAKMDGVETLLLENTDIDKMFEALWSALPQKRVDSYQHHNPESLAVCNFGLTSKLIKSLAPSHAIYRNLTQGFT